MRVNGRAMTTIWPAPDGAGVEIIDQTLLPHRLEILRLADVESAAAAISDMKVRGAPLIGVAAAYGLALAMRADASDDNLDRAAARLARSRPTAVNLQWALERVRRAIAPLAPRLRFDAAFAACFRRLLTA